MTKADLVAEEHDSARSALIRKVLVIAVCAPAMLFGAGVIAGFTVGTLEHGTPTAKDFAILLGILTVWLLIGFAGWKLWPRIAPEPVSSSTRRSMNLLWMACAVGAALGVFFTASGGEPGEVLFSNTPVKPMVAMVGIAVWLLIVPPLTWVWWRSVDEHEASAYTDGALIAAHAYAIIAPIWWLAARAGWVPEQDPMIVFGLVTFLWTAIWLWRRYF